MSTEEIEKEVNEQLKFKLNELRDGMKNRLAMQKTSAFSRAFDGDYAGSQRAQYYVEAWQELLEVFEKEKDMGIPKLHMFTEKITKAKNDLTDDMMHWFDQELLLTKQYTPSFRQRLQKKLADGMEKLLQTKV